MKSALHSVTTNTPPKQSHIRSRFHKYPPQEAFLLSLYKKHQRLLYATVLSIRPDPCQAAHIIRDFLQSLASCEEALSALPPENIRGCLAALLKTRCLELTSTKGRHISFRKSGTEPISAFGGNTGPKPQDLVKVTITTLLHAVRMLDPAERELLILHYYYRCGGNIIAQQLGGDAAGMAMRLAHAQSNLQAAMEASLDPKIKANLNEELLALLLEKAVRNTALEDIAYLPREDELPPLPTPPRHSTPSGKLPECS